LIPFSIRDIEKALEIWPKIFEISPSHFPSSQWKDGGDEGGMNQEFF